MPATSLILLLALAGQSSPDRQGLAALEQRIPALMKQAKVPGLSMVLVREGRIVWHGQFGVRAANRPEAVTRETVFEAASMSKPAFAYAVLKLVEQERLDLDRPLDSYLPEPYLPDQPLAGEITARMVLAHTTGLPNWRKGGWRSRTKPEVAFKPGTRFRYSGEGFTYLQTVVQHLTSQDVATFMDERLLKPLAMNRSSYVWKEDLRSDFAAGHDREGAVKLLRPMYKHANAAFSLYTTAHDYGLFLLEMMHPDREAPHSLNAESVAAMLKLQPIPGMKGDRQRRGLGWVLAPTAKGGHVHHSGSNGTGFRCFARFHPKRRTGLVIMTNAMGGHTVCQAIVGLLDLSPAARPPSKRR